MAVSQGQVRVSNLLTLAPKVAAVMAESRAGRRGGGGGRGWRRGGKPR